MLVALTLACVRPSTEVPTVATPPTEPGELTAWLAAEEARFDDLVPGAEKHIQWVHPEAPAKTDLAVVYLHGFSATRQEVAPLCERLGDALHANVYFARLAGHGRSDDAMAEATLDAWKQDAREAWAIGRTLGDKVLLVSTSTGGTLATWLATTVPQDELEAMVLMSPNFFPKDGTARLLTWPGRKLVLKAAVGDTREWEPANEGQSTFWTWRYPSSALLPMMDLVRLVELSDVSRITTPALLITSPNDEVINSATAQERFADFGSTRRDTWLIEQVGDASNHVLAGDILSPENTTPTLDRILAFVQTR